MRITLSLSISAALLGACVDQPAARSSSGSSGSDTSGETGDNADGTTTVFVTIEGNPDPVFIAYRDGVDGPWLTPTRNAGGVSYALQVHDAYQLVAVCIDGQPFPGFDAESLYATASDGGQSVACGFSSVQLGGGGGSAPPPPPTLTGTVAQPGFVTIGPFNDFSAQPSWSFTDNFVVSELSDLIATDGSNIDIVRDIKSPADGAAKSLGTIDIDKAGSPFATYTATTNPMDADESAQVNLLLQTANGTTTESFSVASLSSQIVPANLVGPLDVQEVGVEAIGPEFTSANGFLFPDLRSATALRIGNTDPLPTRFDLLERLFPAWSRDAAGVVANLRAEPTRADTIELAIQNTQVTDGLITELDIQNVAATPAYLAAAGTKLGFDTSAPGYDASWVVAATTTQDGQVVPNPASLVVSWVDRDTGTLFETENDMPEPGEQAFPPPFAATAHAQVVRHARDRFEPAAARAIATPN